MEMARLELFAVGLSLEYEFCRLNELIDVSV